MKHTILTKLVLLMAMPILALALALSLVDHRPQVVYQCDLLLSKGCTSFA